MKRNKSAFSNEITTVPQLLERAGVDPEKWNVVHAQAYPYANYYEGVQKGGVTATPMHQVKVTLKPKEHKAEQLALNVPMAHAYDTVTRKPLAPSAEVKRIVVLPDAHIGFRWSQREGRLIPFHDRRALDIGLQIVRDLQPDLVVMLGDLLDYAELSTKFLRPADMNRMIQPAINEAHWWLGRYSQAAPKSKKKIIQGNHEDRDWKYFAEAAPAFYDVSAPGESAPMYSIENLLKLAQINWDLIPGGYGRGIFYAAPDIQFLHGVRVAGKSGATAEKVAKDLGEGLAVFGHIHRAESATIDRPSRTGVKKATAFTPGCLCRIDGEVPGHSLYQNWNQGLGLVEYVTGAKDAATTHIKISNGEATYNGKKYVGAPDMKAIVAALPKMEHEVL